LRKARRVEKNRESKLLSKPKSFHDFASCDENYPKHAEGKCGHCGKVSLIFTAVDNVPVCRVCRARELGQLPQNKSEVILANLPMIETTQGTVIL